MQLGRVGIKGGFGEKKWRGRLAIANLALEGAYKSFICKWLMMHYAWSNKHTLACCAVLVQKVQISIAIVIILRENSDNRVFHASSAKKNVCMLDKFLLKGTRREN